MRVFVAGSTGAIGRCLVPQLVGSGHEVVALARSEAKGKEIEAMGATPALADAFDANAMTTVVVDAKPEVVIHELTAINGVNPKNLDGGFVLTNRLRTEVTDTLLNAARKAGAERFIAQSFCGWPFAREGGPVKTEKDPLDPNPPAHFEQTLGAIRYLEEAVGHAKDIAALALRYGAFYGPGTSISEGGSLVDMVRKHKMPIVGDGAGVWSFVHIKDAAAATALAISKGDPGVYNVVDDEPAPVSQWLPVLADAVGAKQPSHVPAWLAKWMIGEGGIAMMTQIRGGSNAKAKRELGWQPAYPSWREGFVHGLN